MKISRDTRLQLHSAAVKRETEEIELERERGERNNRKDKEHETRNKTERSEAVLVTRSSCQQISLRLRKQPPKSNKKDGGETETSARREERRGWQQYQRQHQ
jgi:hypothetical protein